MDDAARPRVGGVPVVLEVLGWDEAFLGRRGHGGRPGGVRRRRCGPRCWSATAAALLGRHRRQQAAGQDRHRLRQAARGLTADHRRHLVRGDGRPPDRSRCGASGRKIAGRLAALGIETVHRPGRPPTTELLVGGVRADDGAVVPPAGPRRRLLARRRDAVGRAGARPRGDLPAEPRRAGARSPDAVRALAARVVEDIDAEGRPAMRVHLKIRYRTVLHPRPAPASCPSRPTTPTVLGDAAVALLDKVEHGPARPAARRAAEMVPPEGGYER